MRLIGELCQLKNLLNFRQVKSDIGDNFSHAWELMCTVVEGFVCLLAMARSEMFDTSSRPVSAPANIETASLDEKNNFFEATCKLIVDQVWKELDTDRLKEDEGTGPPVICCGNDLDDELIGCSSKSSCPKGEYFHYTCAGVDQDNIPVPWYCSDECRQLIIQPYIYCWCGQDLGTDEPMIGCEAESLCVNKEWYHMRCVGIDPDKPPKKCWYCSDLCQEKCRKSPQR